MLLLDQPAKNTLTTGNAAKIRYRITFVLVFTNVNSELYGKMPNAANIGIKTSIGARLNRNLSDLSGVIFSLHKSLKASAIVCKTPQKPTLFGPFLCVKNPKSFLSASTRNKTTRINATATTQNGIT